jgi:hypothetical protein
MYCAYIYILKIAIFGKIFYSGYLAKSSLIASLPCSSIQRERQDSDRETAGIGDVWPGVEYSSPNSHYLFTATVSNSIV